MIRNTVKRGQHVILFCAFSNIENFKHDRRIDGLHCREIQVPGTLTKIPVKPRYMYIVYRY